MDIAWVPALIALGAAIVAFLMLRQNEMQDLFSKMLGIQALKEAYILEGENWETIRLSKTKDLPTEKPSDGGPWLRKVEVRAVLDDFKWNLPEDEDQFYDFLEGRRTWIVRDRADSGIARSDLLDKKGRKGAPALISSMGFEELAAWIERVTSARSGASLWILSSRGLTMIKPLLAALCMKERRETFGTRLSEEAHKFLKCYVCKI
jgi:hypothetical protein